MPHPRVALLHYAAPPVIGGVEATIGAHARLLADRGYPVSIIAGRGEPFDPRVPIHLIPEMDSRHPLVSRVHDRLTNGEVTADFDALAAVLQTALARAAARFDILLAHNVTTLHKNLALTAALHSLAVQERGRLIAWCHDLAWTDPVYANELFSGWPWDLLRTRWPGVRYVVVSSSRRAELERLIGIPAEEIAIVPPGVDPRTLLGLGETAAGWIDTLRLDTAAPLLLVPARVTRRKNIGLAIDITACLRDLGLNPCLLVMGPLGPHNAANAAYLAELEARRRERRVEDAVVFLHQLAAVDDATRRDLYLLADAVLFPSEREGFGIPVLEAGLVRLPLFCSDIPPFRETAGEYACYFKLDEPPKAIASRIAACLQRDPRYQLKQRVWREHAWSKIFDRDIEPLLQEVWK